AGQHPRPARVPARVPGQAGRRRGLRDRAVLEHGGGPAGPGQPRRARDRRRRRAARPRRAGAGHPGSFGHGSSPVDGRAHPGLLARSRAGRMRSLRLVGFVLIWFVAETVALVVLAGLWVVSGFGGRLRTEPYQSRHYAVMRRFLDTLYEAAERTYGLRVEVDEP